MMHYYSYRRNFCPLYLRFLLKSYCVQNMMVRWNGALSFNSSNGVNGVKQGGVLSPLLLSVYLDDLLHQLRERNIGCHMNSDFVGTLMYADDITLLIYILDMMMVTLIFFIMNKCVT